MVVSKEFIETQKIRIWTQRLIEEYRQIQFTYNLKLRIPVIRIEKLSSRWGSWDPEARTLTLSQALIEKYPWETVLEIFKHEIAHQIVTETSTASDIHGPQFKLACEKLGVAPWACRAETVSLPIETSMQAQEASTEEQRLLERAEKLLSLATSDNEHEALLAMQKVQELYARYNLDRIQKNGKAHWGYIVIKLQKRRVERYQSVIASILNDHFFVEVIHTSQFDAQACSDFKSLELLGTRENVLMAEYVFHFLEGQLKGLWKNYQEKTGRKLGVSSRNSFFLGVLEGFRNKLKSSSVSQDTSVALVIRQDEGLKNLVRSRYPKLNRLSGGSRLHDNQAFSAGKKEGQNLVIRKGISKSENQGSVRAMLPKIRSH